MVLTAYKQTGLYWTGESEKLIGATKRVTFQIWTGDTLLSVITKSATYEINCSQI